jgi:acyl carrier protein
MSLSEKTIEVLAGAMSLEPSDITQDTALGVTAAWDSLAHMRLILAIEAILGRNLGPDMIVTLTSAQEVETILSDVP